LICAGVTALAIGFVLGLHAVRPGVSASETVRPKNSDLAFETGFDTRFDTRFGPGAALGSQAPSSRGLRVASLDTDAFFGSATNRQSESPVSGGGLPSSAQEILQSTARAASFDERFSGAIDWPGSPRSVEALARAPASDQGGNAGPRRATGQSGRGLPPLPPVPPAGAKKQLRVADAAPTATATATEDLSAPPDADDHTAIYDISAHKVYLPNGRALEAHSGLGSHLDDPRYVSERDRGPTPPNVYDLSLREESFHGVRALRLNPVGGGNMYGRAGLLAHSYMLGPNGQSNGCVSFNDYSAFLDAYLGGEVTRLVVVEHLANPPGPKTAWGGLVGTIKALFGRT
jgi:hypothetical protein